MLPQPVQCTMPLLTWLCDQANIMRVLLRLPALVKPPAKTRGEATKVIAQPPAMHGAQLLVAYMAMLTAHHPKLQVGYPMLLGIDACYLLCRDMCAMLRHVLC